MSSRLCRSTSAQVCPALLPMQSVAHAWARPIPPSGFWVVFLLWFGWLGFNGGSALSTTDRVAARAVATSFVAAASSMLTFLALERVLKGESTSVGASVGAVAGLVRSRLCDTWLEHCHWRLGRSFGVISLLRR